MLTVTPIDPAADVRWMQYISEHAGATIFHHPQWMRVLQSAYGYRPVCWAATENSSVAGILPLMEVRSWLTGTRAVCLPFSDVCTLLCDRSETAELLVSHCSRLVQQHHWQYVEIRGETFSASLTASQHFKTHLLRLRKESEQVFRTFKPSKLRDMAKAGREGVTIERRQDVDAMREFVRLNALTRKKLGVPPQPDSFFGHLYEHVISQDHGFVSVALLRGSVIAAAVFLHYKEHIIYKYGASDRAYLKHCPNDLLLGDAIRWGCEHNFHVFDFGRTDLHHEGLLRFKRSWGAEEHDLSYYRLSDRQTVSSHPTTELMDRLKPLFRSVPLPILKLVGRVLYRHTG